MSGLPNRTSDSRTLTVWQIPTLKPYLKNLLLSTSANALKLCTPNFTSFTELHSQNLRATPNQFMFYKHSLLLFNAYNNHTPNKDWLDLNFNQNFNSRDPNFRSFSRCNFKIGKNKISERLCILNSKVPLNWLNQDKTTFKLNCKTKFLPNN